MFFLQIEADRAHKGTYEWILTHQSYNTWLKEPHGLLWIKGNPGAGKPTVLAYLYRAYENLQVKKNDVVISFFFHARGTSLQRTKIGMFRSLLNQIYKASPLVRPPIRSIFMDHNQTFGNTGATGMVGWEWHVDELQQLFTSAVMQASTSRRMTIFIDALDEAGRGAPGAARELADYFHELDHLLAIEGRTAKICISCREYPVVATDVRYDIWVNRENIKDIVLYTKDKLVSSAANRTRNTLSQQNCRSLQEEIGQRASGIFQWARLAVEMVDLRSAEGDSFPSIQRRLKEVPSDLNRLYEHILKDLIDRSSHPKAFLLMQWVAFAERPLSMEELRYGMVCDAKLTFGEDELFVDGEETEFGSQRIRAMINSLSGAMIEVKTQDNVTAVQFIHESVRDYLLGDGFKFLGGLPDSHTATRIIGDSHDRLAISCIRYKTFGGYHPWKCFKTDDDGPW